MRKQISEIVEVGVEGKTEVVNLIQVLQKVGLDNLDAEFEQSYGLPIAQAGAAQLRLVSTLGWAETTAVLHRLAGEGHFTKALLESALESLAAGPWRLVLRGPDRDAIDSLAARHTLRGADVWHLAQVRTLLGELPGLRMLTFDRRLREAARREGLLPSE